MSNPDYKLNCLSSVFNKLLDISCHTQKHYFQFCIFKHLILKETMGIFYLSSLGKFFSIYNGLGKCKHFHSSPFLLLLMLIRYAQTNHIKLYINSGISALPINNPPTHVPVFKKYLLFSHPFLSNYITLFITY